ncbi:MAG: TM0106 family RecB-like putative nuclease [Anaerolineae bacterium]|nr:TM0106 family RecB-like putative nuclease [Anaerolineae bacterium]
MPKRISATDLPALTRCDRIVYLDHNGDPDKRAPQTDYQKWLRDQGLQHESRVVSEFDIQQPAYKYDNLEIGYEITLEFMREGVPYIYQGVLMDDDMVGIPDLMQRAEGKSRWGDYHYRPLDIKLASTPTEGYRLQVMAYMALLEAVQDARPTGALLLRIPPDERTDDHYYREEPIDFDDDLYTAKLARVRDLANGSEPRPFYSSTCHECAWREICIPMLEGSQDASLIPGLRRDVWRVLHQRGLKTLADVAAAEANDLLLIKGVGAKTAPVIVNKARALLTGEMIMLGKPDLPPPGDDVMFDVESVPSEGIFYLMGFTTSDGDKQHYKYCLAEKPEDEGQAWKDFLSDMADRRGTIYHYGVYERTTVKKLGERYNTTAEADALLNRMVDLEKVIKDCVVLPLRSVSLKAVAPWLGFNWQSDVQAGDDSMLEYLAWLEDGDKKHLDSILRYNEEDCHAASVVLDWLRGLSN